MINFTDRRCDSCGATITEGDPFYHCRTEIIADNEQLPSDLENTDRIIAQAIAELADGDEKEVLDEAYQEIILVLCPTCRIKLLQLLGSMVSSGCPGCQGCGPKPKASKKGKLLKFPGSGASDEE